MCVVVKKFNKRKKKKRKKCVLWFGVFLVAIVEVWMMISLVWSRTRHVCCLGSGRVGEWDEGEEAVYRKCTSGGRNMGEDIAHAAVEGRLVCDIGQQYILITGPAEVAFVFKVLERPNVVRGVVGLQRLWRLKKK
jgi:hypothetical protein